MQLTLSLGGGISDADLSCSRHGADLMLSTGGGDGLSFAGWFAGPVGRRVAMLQVIGSAVSRGESCSPFAHAVETFDFSAAVAAVEKGRCARHPPVSAWSPTDVLLTQHLASYDSAAVGGLSYQFGNNGSFSMIGSAAVQEIVGSINFGTLAESFEPLADIQAGSAKL